MNHPRVKGTLGKGWSVETEDWFRRVGFELDEVASGAGWRLWKHPLLPDGVWEHYEANREELLTRAANILREHGDLLLAEMYLARLAS